MSAYDVGMLMLRLVLGLTMAAHGYNKFFGSGGIAGTAGWFDSIGMRPGAFHARVAASTEIAAGLGLAGFVALMLVAAWTVHRRNGFFIVKEGWEYNLVLAAAAVTVAVAPGRLSLDHVVFDGTGLAPLLHGWPGLLIALGLGLAGGIGQLVLFYRPRTSEADAAAL